jgi:short-subunit dehydrogenase
MRHQGNGHIINISSVAAVAHIPFQTFYSASKAAISSYSYALEKGVRTIFGPNVERC